MSWEHKLIHFLFIWITISKTSSCEFFSLISSVTKFTSEGKAFDFTIKIALFIGGGFIVLAAQSCALMNMYVLLALSNWNCLNSILSSTHFSSHEYDSQLEYGNPWAISGQFLLAFTCKSGQTLDFV